MINQLGYTETDLDNYKYLNNLKGFDYNDKAIGLSLNIRQGQSEIRINGTLILLKDLQSFLNKYKLKRRRS